MKETAYLLQAALIALWWLGLSNSSRFFDAFQFVGIGREAFWSFLLPDAILIGAFSLWRVYRQARTIELIILGAFAYASLYCTNATLLTLSGSLPTSLMILGLCFNVFLCFQDTLFRSSNSHSFGINATKTLIQIVCIWVLALVVIPGFLIEAFGSQTTPNLGVAGCIGILLFALFSALGLASALFIVRYGDGTPLPLDQTNHLVTRGPYRFVRNPMAIAGIGQGLAIALFFLSLPILVYSLLGALIWHLVVRPVEERDMERRFGASYLEYKRRVLCWIPTWTSK